MNKEVLYKTNTFCPNCNSIAEFGILFEYPREIFYKDDVASTMAIIVLSKCLNCGNPALWENRIRTVEDMEYLDNQIIIYPDLGKDGLNKDVPESIQTPYKEALLCYKVHAYNACVIMCRKGIDAICFDFGINTGKLVQKLKKLNERQILISNFYRWADELRLIGNEGAHSHTENVSDTDAKDCLEFFEALALYLYKFSKQYENLIERRSQRE